MKAPARLITLAALPFLLLTNNIAQKSNYTSNKGLTIGFGLGAAYQNSDLANFRGGGFDFTLGSHLYKKENAFFSVDWKFRFLAGENRAYDHRINPDNTYSNIHYRFFSYDLELGLTLNRLRERTRIVVTGFAGGGLTHGMTSVDLYDAGGSLYDYSGIDPNRDSKLVYDDLVALSDGNFETKLVNRAAVLPTAGVFVGYQFSRSFSMGLEYKTNLYLTETNSPFGLDLDNRVIEGSAMDRNNYVGLAFKWSLGGGSSSTYIPSTYTETTTETIAAPPPVYMPEPVVHIYDPSADPYRTASGTHTLKATIRDVSGSGNISFYQNGSRNNNFSYNAALKTFTAEVQLEEGENTFRIVAENETASAEDQIVITNDPSAAVVEAATVSALISPPEINVLSHVNSATRTFEQSEGMRALVQNVDSKEDITLNINGVNTRDFTFDPNTKVLTTNVNLRDGNNVVNISARNESGSDAEDRVLIRESRPCPTPVVKLIAPAGQESNSNQESYEIWAEVRNVSGKSQIGLAINGRPVSFNFSNNLVSCTVPLVRGTNTITLKATNECGEDAVSAGISYSAAVVVAPPCIPPKVSFTVNKVNRADASHEIRGSVSNITDRAGISVMIDGSTNDGFQFDPTTGILNAPLNLEPGLHTIIVSASNDCGTDNMGVNVNMEEPCIPPKVSYTVTEINQEAGSYSLQGSVSGMKNKSGISFSVDGGSNDEFRFDPQTGNISAEFNLTPGPHSIAVAARNDCGADNQSVSVVAKEPCFPPKVSFSIIATDRDNASHELSGSISNIKDRAGISLTVDGNPDNGFQFDPLNGELNALFNLTPGSHSIEITVNNSCGSDKQGANVIVEEACIPPKISFTVNEVNRDDGSYEIKGSVSNVENRSGISLSVDGSANDAFLFDPATGDLSGSIKLKPGSHTVTVSVSNACGTDGQEVIVNVEESCIPPKVSITVNEVSRNDASHELSGLISNVNDRSGISISVDGSSDDGFQFDPATGNLVSNYQLATGPHTILVSVSNACGSDDQTVNVNIEEPCIPPKVSFTISEVNREDASHDLSGLISNVNTLAGIAVTVDGSTDYGFRFDPASGELTRTFNFEPGSHSVLITANNDCGSDRQEISVLVEEPCIPPKLSFTVNEVNRDDGSYELSGSISNVEDRTRISLTVDGNPVNSFQFTPGTGDLKGTLLLSPGTHMIAMTVNNACGTDKHEVNVIVTEPCIPPRVSFTVSKTEREDASHELRGSVSNVEDRAGITLTVDGNANNEFQFNPEGGNLNANLRLAPGSHTVAISVSNACGADRQEASVIVEEPCIPPKVSFTLNEVGRDDASHELSGSIANIQDRSGISFTLDGSPNDVFQFDPESGVLDAKFLLEPGSHTIAVSVNNACGADQQDVNVIMEEPCIPPKVSFTVAEVSREDASHELTGLISNVKNKSDVSLTLNGTADEGFQFIPSTGELNAKFRLSPGTHMIVVSVVNACGTDNQGVSVIVEEEEEEEEACGVRINPGNSSWQFCLVTPSGTYTREDLTNSNFSYSGPASQLYFLPIGGGGEVTVKGNPYTVRSGRYYLFTGNLDVTVSTSNPGSMGHWSVCVSTDTEPVSGQGNNRPDSPCREKDDDDDDDDNDDDKKGKGKGKGKGG